MPATSKAKYFRGVVPDSEHWVVSQKPNFKSRFVIRGKFRAELHVKLSCGHTRWLGKIKKDVLRTHCDVCEAQDKVNDK